MDALIVQNLSTINTATSNSGSSPDTAAHHHHHHAAQPHVHSCCFSETQLLDNVTKSLVSVDEWIAQELDRISHNSSPRNCLNYEALLSVIEGFYQMDQYTPTTITYQHFTQSKAQQEQSEAEEEEEEVEDQDDDEESEKEGMEDSVGYNNIFHAVLSPSVLDEQQINDNDLEEEKQNENGCDNENGSPKIYHNKISTANFNQLTQKNLVLAFSKLIYYCQHESPQFYLKYHRKPLELLIELENMCDTTTQGIQQKDDIQSRQKRLAHILFGTNVPILNRLVDAWIIISLWVQQEIDPESPFQQQQKWIIFGIYSYQIAKKVCGISNLK